MIVAEWKGGPWDGRVDVLPSNAGALSVAMPMKWGADIDGGEMPLDYVEVRCPIVRTEDGEYLIIWHEAQ